MQEKARNLCESLEGRVDPFDLNVFNPHIQSHVKRSVQRLQVITLSCLSIVYFFYRPLISVLQFIFGPLLTSERHAILWAARLANPAGTKQPETPSVVALVSSSPRFLPLPLVSQKSITETNSGGKVVETSSKEDAVSSGQVCVR